jgi:HlyD family secretion protein
MWDKLKNWRWAIAIAGLVVLGLGYSFWPEAQPVDLGDVTRGEMHVGITDDGVTRVHDLYTVTAPVTGHITRIELDAGDEVVAGDTVIATMTGLPSAPLDPRSRAELQQAINASLAAERSAVAALELSQSDLARAEELAQRGFLATARLEAERTAAQSREADVQRIRAETARLRASLAGRGTGDQSVGAVIAVRSPESGVVLRRLSESEGVVSLGTPLMEIGNASQIEVVIDLLSREAVQVEPGAKVEITRWGGPDPLPGRVRLVEPFGRLKISALGIEEQRVNVIVDFAPDAAAQIAALGHGYQVDGTVILWEADDVLRVPVGALFRGPQGEWQVFVGDAARASVRNVTVGHINDEHAEVLGGLELGERVVLNPGRAIEDGVRISERS